MMMMRGVEKFRRYAVCLLIGIFTLISIGAAPAQEVAGSKEKFYERSFPQSKAAIEKALKELQPSLAGRLPTLEGFAAQSDQPLDRYRRGYYQSTVQVEPSAQGSVVRVKMTVTAWYAGPTAAANPAPSRAGYQILLSNGRLEADVLDQLADALARQGASVAENAPPTPKTLASTKPLETAPSPAAPVPQFPKAGGTFASSVSQGLAANTESISPAKSTSPDASKSAALRAEAANLEEILKNQSHPKNLVAVKKAGTAVVASPSLNAKSLFLASAHDEFEMLDFNQDWVHVRVSGLARGWIWRNSVEMPQDIPDTATQGGPAPASEMFRVAREDTSSFPGDWAPLRGKSVTILSLQKTPETPSDLTAEMKLEFAKSLLSERYQAAAKSSEIAGIVLIFDSADGGMIAAPLSVLKEWKAGTLSDAALWHQCFFDPPESLISASSSGGQ